MKHDIRWTSAKIAQRLHLVDSLVYRQRRLFDSFRLRVLRGPHLKTDDDSTIDKGDWTEVAPNSYWIELQTGFLLRSRFSVPADWDSRLPVALFLPLGESGDFSHPEALTYIDGEAYAACDRHHQEILLSREWCDGQDHELLLHGWSGGTQLLRFDGHSAQTPRNLSERLWLGECALVQIDQPTREFVALARATLGVADSLSENQPARAHLYNALDESFRVLETREPVGDGFYDSIKAAHQVLQNGVKAAGQPLDVDVTAVGHAHIDVAWLWTLDQTRHKAGRSFYNVLRLMEQFPEFRFTQSQPQLYEYVRQDYPELFAAIRQHVQRGEWEPIGGMWVEADCNLTGPESLARQFLLGRSYFKKHFGDRAESPVLWLPDVFGYAWNLPQLMKEAGLTYFFTIKIGWSQYNRLPYDSFWWQGLDGSKVLTHFSPTKDPGSAFASTYNAAATPGHVFSTWTNFQQKDGGKPGQTPPLLMSYGYGNGGGGPTREMQENLQQLASFPSAPRVHCGKVIDFFRALEESVGDQLPTWNGELYLEYHRGTYTTQARNKRANRKSEFLLHDAEFLATLALTMDGNYTYPRDLLQRAWELVCLNQFHDILPGSSIGAVYEESLEQYTEVANLGQRVRADALEAISEVIGAKLLAVNPTAFLRREILFVPGEPQRDQNASKRVQMVSGGYLLDTGELPPYSVTPLKTLVHDDDVALEPVRATKYHLENDLLRVEFASNGDIERIWDKRCSRDILPDGQIANQFQAFEDRPKTPDAWEIDIFYDDRVWFAEAAHAVDVIEDGPLRGTLEIRRRIFNSEIIQHISLVRNSARIDFKTQVDWYERHTLLKVAFPVDVLSTVATYEIQWGNVERPTHRNTSWDWARFETCAQKWVDLSEGDYGVSLLNDCKYGHDIWENVIRLTLLRGPTDPDPEADLGAHTFTYSLLPHTGPWGKQTLAEAYALNDPPFVFDKGGEPPPDPANKQWAGVSLVMVDKPHIVIETVKLAEDGRGIIVRLYESRRRRGRFILKSAFLLAGAWRTNLLEEDQAPLAIAGHEVHAEIKPYQIMTLRLLPE